MSIENNLDRIAAALEAIARQMEHGNQQMQAVPAVPAPMNPNPFVPPEQQFAAAPAPAVPVPAASAPAVPVPAAAPAPAIHHVPFTDQKGLMAYTMEKYRTLGPVKGGQIQTILQELGAANMNSLSAEKYADFYNRVEAL